MDGIGEVVGFEERGDLDGQSVEVPLEDVEFAGERDSEETCTRMPEDRKASVLTGVSDGSNCVEVTDQRPSKEG